LIANEAPNEDYYLNIYDIENKNYTKLSPNQKDENILFSAFKEAGNLLFSGNKIYSVKPFGNDLYIYDPSSIDTPKSISLEILSRVTSIPHLSPLVFPTPGPIVFPRQGQ
jgi:hypothetical protein